VNELQQKKIIEIDARPSDCIAMATQQPAPIYVSLDVWDELEDMTEALRKNRRQWLGGLNIFWVISVSQHLASVLPGLSDFRPIASET
jgi:bifunctional DNase/RNase